MSGSIADRPTYGAIFVPGGFPVHTYNPRASLRLEEQLSEVRRNLCKLVAVTGQTKSGKTVFSRKVLPPAECVWVNGGSVKSEDDLWAEVINQLGAFTSVSLETSKNVSSGTSANRHIEGSALVAKGGADWGSERQEEDGVSREFYRTVPVRAAALRELQRTGRPLVIDDFHYLPRELQGDVIRALKQPVFDGLPVVIIAIPHRRYDAMKVEREMTGRVEQIAIPVWTPQELQFIPRTGFELLSLELEEAAIERLSNEAIGSPHLMQEFCRAICRIKGVTAAATSTTLTLTPAELDEVFRSVAASIGRPIFEKLARGPRQRTDRKRRRLKDGTDVDIYQLILRALAFLRPGLVSLEYEELRAAIRSVATELPQLQEVARVLKYMATIAASDESSTPVIDFEEAEKKLHITDPFFAFYLRWGELRIESSSQAIPAPLE